MANEEELAMLRTMCAARLGVILVCVFGCFSAAAAASGEDRTLLELAEERFGLLMPAEKELFKKVPRGQTADLRIQPLKGNESLNDPNEAEKWGNERVIRSKCIEWLCTDTKATKLVTHKGIQVAGVRFDGELDLSFAKIPFPLFFIESAFTHSVYLQHAEVEGLYLNGTHTREIKADGIKVNGPVHLRDGFKANGEVRFNGATVDGNFNCVNGKFINHKGKALHCDWIEVKGCVFLRNDFKAEGAVRFLGASVGIDFDCENGKFSNPKGYALTCDGLEVKGCVVLRNGFKSEGDVRFIGAIVGGDFDCLNGKFSNPKGYALICDGMAVKGNVFLKNGFSAKGKVRLLGATVGGNFECENSKFNNPEGRALQCGRVEINGSVFLNNDFKAEGEVRFSGATVGGSFGCKNGKFNNPEGKALVCESMAVKGNVFLRDGFRAEGEVDFIGAKVGGYFIWTGVESPEKAILDLRSAKVGVLWDDERSWPGKGKLFLDGFVYDEIYEKATKDVEKRLKWLGLQREYSPGPYEQLAKVFREGGHEDAAKTVLVAKNEEKAKQDDLTSTERIWYKFFGPMIGYGYRSWRALRYVAGFFAAGWIFFGIGWWTKVITPTHMDAYNEDGGISENYPKFNFLMYSVDMFVPLVNLHQAEYWLPNANRGRVNCGKFKFYWGGFLRFYLWLHIAAGWVLTTLLVVGLTGLVAK